MRVSVCVGATECEKMIEEKGIQQSCKFSFFFRRFTLQWLTLLFEFHQKLFEKNHSSSHTYTDLQFSNGIFPPLEFVSEINRIEEDGMRESNDMRRRGSLDGRENRQKRSFLNFIFVFF
jgi:hypothetical protein